MQMIGAQRSADGGDHVPPARFPDDRAARTGHVTDRLEVELHPQLLGGEQQLLQDVSRVGQPDQQAQRQLALHDHLLDVVQRRALLGQDAGQRRRDSRAVASGHGDQHPVVGVGQNVGSLVARPGAATSTHRITVRPTAYR